MEVVALRRAGRRGGGKRGMWAIERDGDGREGSRREEARWWLEWGWMDGAGASGEEGREQWSCWARSEETDVCVCACAGAGNQIGDAGAADLGRGLAQMGNLTSLTLYLQSAWPVR